MKCDITSPHTTANALYILEEVVISLEGHSFSVSNLNIITTAILLIDVTEPDKKLRKENTNTCTNTFLTILQKHSCQL